jgi:hypothetical protein
MALLPLENWRQMMQFHPWHFWGLADSGLLKAYEGCSPLTRQYAWQNSDAASRSEVVQAVETAEQRLFDELDFWPAPAYGSETVAYPWSSGAWGRWPNIQLGTQYVQAAGVEALTLISAGAAVAFSDTDSDGYNDTFTVGPVATTVTDTSEIVVYFAATDRFAGPDYSTDVSDRWRVQPIRVSIGGGNATIKGPAWLLIRPVLYEGIANIGASGLDPATAANFATTLDVYRRSTDRDGTTTATSQAAITWETRPCHGWWCCECTGVVSGSEHDPAATALALARVGLRDAVHGIVSIGEAAYNASTSTWSEECPVWCDAPDRVVVRTLAGYPLAANGQMDPFWQTVVARFAAAELARPICGCEDANRELFRWQFDLARTSGSGDEAYGAISARDLDNPFGTRRGHVWAWRAIQTRTQLRGFLA